MNSKKKWIYKRKNICCLTFFKGLYCLLSSDPLDISDPDISLDIQYWNVTTKALREIFSLHVSTTSLFSLNSSVFYFDLKGNFYT